MIEFDEDRNAIYSPKSFEMDNFPKIGIMVFDDDSWYRIIEQFKLIPVINSKGKEIKNYFIYNYNGIDILLFWGSCGAPVAAMEIESAIASGVETIVAFGTAGSLDKNIEARKIIVPSSAFREEGTSYHYMNGNNIEIFQNRDNIDILKETIEEFKLSYIEGKTWTNDAIYRETRNKFKIMKERGCVCVDMECSALIAIAELRDIDFVQFLLAADNLDSENHEGRAEEQKENYIMNVIDIALETALKIQRKRERNIVK